MQTSALLIASDQGIDVSSSVAAPHLPIHLSGHDPAFTDTFTKPSSTTYGTSASPQNRLWSLDGAIRRKSAGRTKSTLESSATASPSIFPSSDVQDGAQITQTHRPSYQSSKSLKTFSHAKPFPDTQRHPGKGDGLFLKNPEEVSGPNPTSITVRATLPSVGAATALAGLNMDANTQSAIDPGERAKSRKRDANVAFGSVTETVKKSRFTIPESPAGAHNKGSGSSQELEEGEILDY